MKLSDEIKNEIKERMTNIINQGKEDNEKSVENVMFRQGYYKALEDLLKE